MVKYKLLLVGKNNTVIDDFFTQLQLDFDMLTTSYRYEDMDNHLQYVAPDMMILCLNGEGRDEFSRMTELRRRLNKMEVQLAIIGEKEEVDNFQAATISMADLVITKPITISEIKDQIIDRMKAMEEAKAEEERLEKERQANEEKKRRKHILVVDDEPMMLKMIQEQLSDKYDVATAISGKIAFKFLEKKGTDLILMDYQMPTESGAEVMAKIRDNSQYDDIPIVFLTGVTDKEKIKEVLTLKPNGYILKPLDRDKLRSTIEKLIG